MHVMTDQTALLVKLFVFAVGVLPLLMDNLRTSCATNQNNLILGAAGVVMVGIEHAAGWNQQSLSGISAWIVFGVIGLLVFAMFSGAPGGVAKTLMALLPWLQPWDFFVVFSAGFLLVALIGYSTGRTGVPIVPSFVIACISVWCVSHIALGLAAGGAVLLCGWLGSPRQRPRVRDRMERVRTRVGGDI